MLIRFLIVVGLTFCIAESVFDGPPSLAWKSAAAESFRGTDLVASQSSGVQITTASWYGGTFIHRIRADGMPYGERDMFAAHPSLPLGTVILVTDLRTRRSIRVPVLDRGPWVAGRSLDLSVAAAQALGMQQRGLDRVAYSVIR